MITDLVAFLRARLDEDERLARDAVRHCAALIAAEATREGLGFYNPPYSSAGAEWSSDADHVYAHDPRPEQPKSEIADFGSSAFMLTPHIQNHSPARVLAEAAGKRQILAASNTECLPGCATAHSFSGSCSLRWMGPLHEDADGRWLYDDTGARHAPPPVTTEWTLRLLALPYAGHPDYRPEWTPAA